MKFGIGVQTFLTFRENRVLNPWAHRIAHHAVIAKGKIMKLKVAAIVVSSLMFVSASIFADCIGYNGPGGPCSTGPGGGLYTGPGGGFSTGTGGGISTSPGGGLSTGPGGGLSTGPGGGLSTEPGGGLSTDPGTTLGRVPAQ